MRILRVIATVIGWAAVAVAVVSLTARYLPISDHVLLVATAFSPYLMLSAVVAVLVFALRRLWLPVALAVAVVIAAIVVEGPLFMNEAVDRADTAPVRVITANLYLGQTDPASLVTTAESGADLLAVQELTPEESGRLSAAGIDRTFPYHVLDPRSEASGTGLWSRFPISQPQVHREYVNGLISGRLRVDDIANDLTVLVAHMPGPWPQPIGIWERELRSAPQILSDAARSAGAGCVIVAGDFNATYDMKPFRDLLRDGYRDGAEQSGSGITTTYPANSAVPPFMGIDHVLTHQCAATSVDVVRLPGSDHRGLRSTIEVPKNP
jgi:endonuclease/exonuclease/phosphatase (EEP) superfamily protein YafD